MSNLIIEVVSSDGRSASFAFQHSPVAIGSGSLSDLVLDFPFISQCHAAIRFEDSQVRYIDLGSRNGSVVAGAAAKPNSPVLVQADTDIVLGPLRLRASMGGAGAEVPDEDRGDIERPYFGAADQGDDRRAGARRGETIGLPVGFSAAEFLVSLATPAAAPQRTLSCHLTGVVSRLALPRSPGEAERDDRSETAAAPCASPLAPATSPASVGVPVHRQPDGSPYVVAQTPQQEPAARAGFTRVLPSGVAAKALQGSPQEGNLRDRLEALAAALPADADRRLLLGLVMVAEYAADAFIGLRGARKALAAELGIRAVQGSEAVQKAPSATGLLAYLLGDPNAAPQRVRQLARATSEMLGIHEMAFMGALRDGVGELVEHLDPRGPAFQQRRNKLGAFTMRDYEAFYESETEDPWQVIFGDRFAYSYAGSTQEETAPPDDAVEPAPRPPVAPGGVEGSPRSTQPRFARIRFAGGPLAGRAIGLAVREVTIGRADDNVIVVDHPSVSRYHAVIIREGEQWSIAEAGSRNGIIVNGQPVASALLHEGDRVDLGEVSFRFQSGAPPR